MTESPYFIHSPAICAILGPKMHVRIRKLTSTTKDDDLVLKVSKTALIEELQKMICSKLNVEIRHQMLYYRGKQVSAVLGENSCFNGCFS